MAAILPAASPRLALSLLEHDHSMRTESKSFYAMELLQTKGGNPMEKKVLAAMKKAGKPVRPGDIAKALGVDGKEQGKVISPKRCFYEPSAG
jgi:hypothetical protein